MSIEDKNKAIEEVDALYAKLQHRICTGDLTPCEVAEDLCSAMKLLLTLLVACG